MQEIDQRPLFPEQQSLQPCSWVECAAGHRWPPKVVLAGCPGCRGPFLAFEQGGCPFCNEPIKLVSLRVDVVPKGAPSAPRCRGVKVGWESMDVVLEPHGQEQAMAEFKTFLQKQAAVEAQSDKTPVGGGSGSDLGGCMASRELPEPGRGSSVPAPDPAKPGISIEI